MGGVDDPHALGHRVDIVHEDGALVGQFVHNKAVVYDLLTHVNGRAKGFQGNSHNVDGADDPGAETAGLQQEHSFAALRPARGQVADR